MEKFPIDTIYDYLEPLDLLKLYMEGSKEVDELMENDRYWERLLGESKSLPRGEARKRVLGEKYNDYYLSLRTGRDARKEVIPLIFKEIYEREKRDPFSECGNVEDLLGEDFKELYGKYIPFYRNLTTNNCFSSNDMERLLKEKRDGLNPYNRVPFWRNREEFDRLLSDPIFDNEERYYITELYYPATLSSETKEALRKHPQVLDTIGLYGCMIKASKNQKEQDRGLSLLRDELKDLRNYLKLSSLFSPLDTTQTLETILEGKSSSPGLMLMSIYLHFKDKTRPLLSSFVQTSITSAILFPINRSKYLEVYLYKDEPKTVDVRFKMYKAFDKEEQKWINMWNGEEEYIPGYVRDEENEEDTKYYLPPYITDMVDQYMNFSNFLNRCLRLERVMINNGIINETVVVRVTIFSPQRTGTVELKEIDKYTTMMEIMSQALEKIGDSESEDNSSLYFRGVAVPLLSTLEEVLDDNGSFFMGGGVVTFRLMANLQSLDNADLPSFSKMSEEEMD